MFLSAQASANSAEEERELDSPRASERASSAASQRAAAAKTGPQRAVDIVLSLTEEENDFSTLGYHWPHGRSVRQIAETVGPEFLLFAGLQE